MVFSLALTVGLLFVLPVAVSLVFKLFTALVYHPKAAEPCPEGSDEQIAEKLFRFADDSFELNAKLNDRGKAPKIVSMAATAIMAGLSIYGFIFVTGAQIKVSIPPACGGADTACGFALFCGLRPRDPHFPLDKDFLLPFQ